MALKSWMYQNPELIYEQLQLQEKREKQRLEQKRIKKHRKIVVLVKKSMRGER
jgi:hypothetical protein